MLQREWPLDLDLKVHLCLVQRERVFLKFKNIGTISSEHWMFICCWMCPIGSKSQPSRPRKENDFVRSFRPNYWIFLRVNDQSPNSRPKAIFFKPFLVSLVIHLVIELGSRAKDSSRFKKTHARQRWKWKKKKMRRERRKKRYLRQRARQ